MRGTGGSAFSALAIAALTLGACGGGSHAGKSNLAAQSLKAPIYPSCGTGTFARPQAKALGARGKPRGWEVVYVYPSRGAPAPRPAATTSVNLVEFGPSRSLTAPRGARVIKIAGRDVSFVDRTKRTSYVAKWQTARASYLALANGSSPATLKKIIGCLP